MCASGVLLDKGMAYFDARLSASYPTVEVRVADVCMDPADAVLVAALSRGLVETAAREWAEGYPRARGADRDPPARHLAGRSRGCLRDAARPGHPPAPARAGGAGGARRARPSRARAGSSGTP